jgi:type II secretory pathway pseudopilin PulG
LIRRQRRAFTLIEVMVVVGIMIILVGIVAYGLSKVTTTTKIKSTGTTLAVMKSMLAEFEVATKGLSRQPAYMWQTAGGTGQWVPPGPPIDIWRDGNPGDGPSSATNPEPDPAKVDAGSLTKEAGARRYEMPMVGNTQLVMGLLLQAQGNKKLMDQISPTQLMEQLPGDLNAANVTITIRNAAGNANVLYTATATNRNPSPPVILDGFGNPIVFVPAGGLWNVRVGDVTRGQVKLQNGPDDLGPVRSPDGRPFFVSAGPDGVLGFVDSNGNNAYDPGEPAGGDDNIYSFDSH